MKKPYVYVATGLILLVTGFVVHTLTTQRQVIQLKNIKIETTDTKLKRLETDYAKLHTDFKSTSETNQAELERLKQREQQLDAERTRLEAELQAKRQRQATIANAVVPAVQAAPAAPTGTCADWIRQAGVSDVANAMELIRRESNCNPNAVNRSSGACGIPQALPCSKLGTSDPVAQIRWMQSYVDARYGGWAGAIGHHNRMNWY